MLAGQKFIDVGRLVLAQRLGHQPEAAAQLVDFYGLADGQRDIEVTLAELICGLGQGFDGLPEAAGDVVCGKEAKHQHNQTRQAEYTTDQ
ncbi:hypothetical protein D3C81_1535270 [compost metagenome]